ncbi:MULTISPECIES: Hsp20/alpha crystallin family protein [Calothrix]|uniref:Hsp20/alpha crystallin family protein n=2 Tax=Calothrix TaxID=1186 RepID=A0ABR8A6R0_9CYAN|nr:MULTISPECIES: Hsp20/alpha crystallin family protein [Calothrix]MBD2195319.1 Hsp20/alpha crystallin family protein [Calothrix parietina FACHB-288]MBD2223918.1 Hsp20/alpha crystallin family protein [Calothrix anomala FACHB-343]
MALIRWQPFSEMETLRRQMDKMFDELAGANSQITQAWTPAIELQDTTESIILRAEIPGIEGKDLDVHVTREAVSIAGETRQESKQQEGSFFRSEFRYGKFQRIVNLPAPIQNDRVQAEFKNGILTLTLPKVEEVKKKVVKINLGESQGAIAPAESPATGDVWADSNS